MRILGSKWKITSAFGHDDVILLIWKMKGGGGKRETLGDDIIITVHGTKGRALEFGMKKLVDFLPLFRRALLFFGPAPVESPGMGSGRKRR